MQADNAKPKSKRSRKPIKKNPGTTDEQASNGTDDILHTYSTQMSGNSESDQVQQDTAVEMEQASNPEKHVAATSTRNGRTKAKNIDTAKETATRSSRRLAHMEPDVEPASPTGASPKTRKLICHAKTQTENPKCYADRASICDFRLPIQASSTQTQNMTSDVGVLCDLRPLSCDEGNQTDKNPDPEDFGPWKPHVSYFTKCTQTINQLPDQDTSDRPEQRLSTVGVQTNFCSVDVGVQTTACDTAGEDEKFDGALFAAALRLIDEARDVIHRHVETDLDRMGAGREVDVEGSAENMLGAVQDVAQRALDEHGEDILRLPFDLMARDYLTVRAVDVEF